MFLQMYLVGIDKTSLPMPEKSLGLQVERESSSPLALEGVEME
jgi:hypothetical protein